MLKKMQTKVDNLAEKTLNQNQNKDMKVTAKRNDV